MRQNIKSRVILALALGAMGILLPHCGGLNEDDFKQVNVAGFDAEDNALDKNDYSYSMEYFKADGADDGYLYVGTCNNMGGLIGFYVDVLANGGDILDAPVRPPEILRYRPDWGPTEWETVFDYRDVEAEPNFKTIGFRFMTIVELPDGGKTGATVRYLYAATQGEESLLWRTRSGDYGEWEHVFTYEDLGGSIRWLEQLDGRVYAAVAYDSFGEVPPPGEIWVSDDGVNFRPIMQDGFGDPNNRGVQALIAYQGWIYAGTKNDIDGFDIWKLRPRAAGSDDYEYVRVVSGGGPSAHNENAGMPIVFKNKLYFGTQLYIAGFNPTSGNAFEGCDIIRINEDDSWETIVGPESLSGYESGFNHFTNSYLWWMEEHDGWLYASTFDQGTLLSGILGNFDGVLDFLQGAINKELEANDYYGVLHAGGDIFKTCNGVDWYPVTMDGMNDPRNYGWRTMKSCPDGYLYVGSANTTTGSQVWRARERGRDKAAREFLKQFE
jgi:hypothetical protein